MFIDIKTIISRLDKVSSINWYIYLDSNRQNEVLKKENDRSETYLLETDLNINDDYYLFIEAIKDDKQFNLGPLLILRTKRAEIDSNDMVFTPIVDIITNKDKNGNIISYTFKGSEYNGIYEFDNCIIRITDGDNKVLNAVINNTSATVRSDKFSNGIVYTIELIYRSKSGVSNNVIPVHFIFNNGEPILYYTVNNDELVVDRLIEFYLNKSKILNNIIADNVFSSLVIDSIRLLIDDINKLSDNYKNGKDINNDIIELKNKVINVINNLTVSGITDKNISDLVVELKNKYKL